MAGVRAKARARAARAGPNRDILPRAKSAGAGVRARSPPGRPWDVDRQPPHYVSPRTHGTHMLLENGVLCLTAAS